MAYNNINDVVNSIKQKQSPAASILKPIDTSSLLKAPTNKIKVHEFDVPKAALYDRLSDGSYISKYENYIGAKGNEDRLAKQQSGLEQAFNGIVKNSAKVFNYAADSIVGTVYGIASGISRGKLNAVYDNDFSNFMDDTNKKLDNNLVNYYTDEEKSQNWLKSLGTVNFWANDVAGGLAFVAGAILPEIAIGYATGGATIGASMAKFGAKIGMKTLAKEGAEILVKEGAEAIAKKAVKQGTEKILSKEGLKSLRAYTYARAGNKAGTVADNALFLARTSNFEAGMEARQNFRESIDTFYNTFEDKNGRKPTYEESKEFIESSRKAANGVYGANLAILSVSNTVMFGKKILPSSLTKNFNKLGNKLIGLGTKTETVAAKEGVGSFVKTSMAGANKTQKILGNTYKILRKPISEGLYEEGFQGVAGKTMQNYLEAKYDPKHSDSYSAWAAMHDAFNEQYTTNEGWKEMGIGMIIGFAGGAIQPGALKSGTAFEGFGKNSYKSAYKAKEEGITRSNKGIEVLASMNRTSAIKAMSDLNASGKTDGFSDNFENKMHHFNFIKSQETISDSAQIRNTHDQIIDNLNFDEETTQRLEDLGISQDDYRTSLKNEFKTNQKNYNKAKSTVEALGLDKRLKNTPGNLAEIGEALTMNIMLGTGALESARMVASEIDDVIGGNGIYNHLLHYATLNEKSKDTIEEINSKDRELQQLKDTAVEQAQKLNELNSKRQEGAKTVDTEYKKTSQLAVLTQQRISKLEKEKEVLQKAIDSEFNANSYDLQNALDENIPTTVTEILENVNKLDDLITSFRQSGRNQEADGLDYLINKFKSFTDSHREMVNMQKQMADTNFFSSKPGKNLVSSILGLEYSMSDKLKKDIEENNQKMDESLNLYGIRDYDTVQELLKKTIEDNEDLSDREKFRLESLIRLQLTTGAMEYQKGILEEAYDNVIMDKEEVADPMEGDTVALKNKLDLKDKDLNNIDILNEAINDITSQLDGILNSTTDNSEEIARLNDELEKLRKERDDLEKGKTSKPSSEDSVRQEAETIMASNLPYNDKINKLVDLGLLTTVNIKGNKTNTAIYNGRLIHFMNLNGTVLPIYRSSNGTSGKAQGGWYPFFGFGNLYEEAIFNDVNNTASGTKNTGKVAGYGDQGWLIKGTGSGEVTYNYEQGHGIEGIQYMQGLFNKNVNFSVSSFANKTEFEDKGFTTDSTEQIDTSDRSILDFNKSIFGQENLGVYNGDSFTRNQNSKFPLETIGNITNPITPKEWIKSIVDKLNETTTTTTDIEAKINITPEHREILNMLPNYSKVKISIENDRGGLGYVGDFNERESELDKTSRMSTTIKYSGLPSSEIYTHELLHYFTIPALLQYKQGNVVGNIKTYVEGLNTLYQKAKSLGYSPINGVSIYDNLNEFAVNITNTNSVENLKQIGIYSDLIQLTQNYLESLTNPVQQNDPFSDTEAQKADAQTVKNRMQEIVNAPVTINITQDADGKMEQTSEEVISGIKSVLDQIGLPYSDVVANDKGSTYFVVTKDGQQHEILKLVKMGNALIKPVLAKAEWINHLIKTQPEDLYNFVNAELAILSRSVQQNAPISDTEQEDTLNRINEIDTRISEILKSIDDLSQAMKLLDSEDFIRHSELVKKKETVGLNENEEAELEALRNNIDQWTMVTGVVVEGFRLSDLIEQKLIIEGASVLSVEKVAVPTTEDTIDATNFPDRVNNANYRYGQTYQNAFVSYQGSTEDEDATVTLHYITESALKANFEGKIDIPLERDAKNNIVIAAKYISEINEKTDIRIVPTNSKMNTYYSVLLKVGISPSGEQILEPVESTFKKEFNNKQGHNIKAAYEANPGDTVAISIDPNDDYNKELIAEYKKAAKSGKNIDDAKEVLREKLLLTAKVGGKVVSTFKKKSKGNKTDKDLIFEDLRNAIIDNDANLEALLKAKGPIEPKVIDKNGNISIANITVSQVRYGHPNYNYMIDADGKITVRSQPLSDTQRASVKDMGYALGGKTFTRDKSAVDTTYIQKMSDKNQKDKIPFIVLEVGGKRVAYPVTVASKGVENTNEFEAIYNNNNLTVTAKVNALNKFLASKGVDIKQTGNAFISFGETNLNDEFFNKKLAELKSINYFYNVSEWIDTNNSMDDILSTQVTVDIDVLNPFHSPKLSFDYSKLDLNVVTPVTSASKSKKSKKKTAKKVDPDAPVSALYAC